LVFVSIKPEIRGSMRKHRLIHAEIAALAILSLILGTGSFSIYRRIPKLADQGASTDETTVIIVNPSSEDRYPADAAIPMTAMELWVDGAKFAAQSPAAEEDPRLF
jgi:hypothetical protein